MEKEGGGGARERTGELNGRRKRWGGMGGG